MSPPDAALLFNENIPQQVADELTRRFGHDVLTSLAAGNANRSIPDQDVLAFAAETARILLTHNRLHFIRLHRQTPHHAGIALCTVGPDFKRQAERIHAAIEAEGEMGSKLIRVNRPSGDRDARQEAGKT